jgi:hypothetical protein
VIEDKVTLCGDQNGEEKVGNVRGAECGKSLGNVGDLRGIAYTSFSLNGLGRRLPP